MAGSLQDQMQALVDGMAALDHDSAVTVITSILQARPELAPPVISFAVPDLTYPPHKALTERRAEGTIKSFNEMKGFGFLECQELQATFGNDVFLHNHQLAGFSVGDFVSFAVMLSKDNKPQAYDLQAVGKGGSTKGGFKGASNGEWSTGWLVPGAGKKGGGMLGPSTKGMAKSYSGVGFAAAWGKGEGKGGDDGGKRKGTRLGATCGDDAEYIGDYEGLIKSFNHSNGYGFIDCAALKDAYGNDTFLHQADLGACQVGSFVTFSAFLNSAGKPQAKNVVEAVQGSAAKRARTEA